eukprot:TRINITY_DN32248_c0_g1_i1.p1 TRINITY_DN32248_c0_g1~~TRINITY_DN32248_c0_g1_i1.p1  ORF type:complete len:854 (+),score=87.34 TRINITY_DN32248_c0_g1_i1:63-2624(+)
MASCVVDSWLHGASWRERLRPHYRTQRTLVGLSLVVAVGLPGGSNAALSISSGYESFLTDIRRRIVCAEEDVYDETLQRGKARPCDSLEDGPFCRGLPAMPLVARHHPFTVDSIVPQHILGTQAASSKSATTTLNTFLEQYYNPKDDATRLMSTAVEGRLRFEKLLPVSTGDVPMSFSDGLPKNVMATFSSGWQAVAVPHVLWTGKRSTALRLNGAFGTLRFSRPVVVRRLVVRPPLDAPVDSRHVLHVRARKSGREVWRQTYDFSIAAAGPARSQRPLCDVGDFVIAKYNDGRYYLASIVEAFETFAIVRWLDDDITYRFLSWRQIKTQAWTSCSQHAFRAMRAKSEDSDIPPPWRDLARRVKSLDEISFFVPSGAEGWLLSEVEVIAPPWSPSMTEEGDDAQSQDPKGYKVQVFPGRTTAVVETSQVAVMYNADDMLERGLSLTATNDATSQIEADAESKSSEDKGTKSTSDEADSSARLRTSMVYSVEGVQQFLRNLATSSRDVPAFKLPPHVSRQKVLTDLENLVASMSSPSKKDVSKYQHFEQFFSMSWEVLVSIDALRVSYERWRKQQEIEALGSDVFKEGQVWKGVYHCTQGPTAMSLEITKVTQSEAMPSRHDMVEAELSFRAKPASSSKDSDDDEPVEKGQFASGRYTVTGRFGADGRSLTLEPVPNSWKDKPSNFVMVGLHGVATRHGNSDRSNRFAGFVPSFGCDSFELMSQDDASSAPASSDAVRAQGSKRETPLRAQAENVVLAKISRTLDKARLRWREQLVEYITEKKEKKSSSTSIKSIADLGDLSKHLTAQAVAQLLEAARSGNTEAVTFEVDSGSGDDSTQRIVLRVGDAEVLVGG